MLLVSNVILLASAIFVMFLGLESVVLIQYTYHVTRKKSSIAQQPLKK